MKRNLKTDFELYNEFRSFSQEIFE
jgi:hypothetical protein